MTRLAVVVHSDSGTTRTLAEAVREGAASVEGIEATLHEVDRKRIVEGRFEDEALLEALDAVDAIVFGCPTFMGSMSGPMKALLDATLQRWYGRVWSGKVAAGFTVSSTPSGDKLSALNGLMMNAMQHGMVWVGLDQSPLNADHLNRLGFYVGAAAQPDYSAGAAAGEPPPLMPGDRETGVVHGARVARIAHALATNPAAG